MKTIFSTSIVFLILLSMSHAQGINPPTPTMGTQGGGSDQPGIQMNGAIGATVINGKSYQYFSLRPDIPIWRFGVGLDLSLYFDADGNLREDDWDEFADIIDKIYYLRYGRPSDPLYLRAGSLDPITLGYGLIMRRYSNAIEWPQVRRVGLHGQFSIGDYRAELVINNFRELDSPGLIAARATYEMSFILPVVFGATVAYDGNQFLGAKDSDNDGIPDRVDQFPGKKDRSHIEYLRGLLEPYQIESLIRSGDLPNINDAPYSIDEVGAEVAIFGVDVGVPLIRNDNLTLWTYAQAAQIASYGRGITFPGLYLHTGPFYAGIEYRIFGREFRGDFFNLSYELERVRWNENASEYETKESSLADLPSANGYYAEAGANILSLVDLFAAYQHMNYKDSGSMQSFYAIASANTRFIPRIDLLQAYFQQPDASDLFSIDADGTVIGWRVGTSLAGGIMLIYDQKTIYHNRKPNRVMTIETAIRF